MNIKELLPIGSVVLLKEGVKKTMIIGIKQTDVSDAEKEYDYIGVLYPEGFIGGDYQFLFNHEDIADVAFVGMNDEERSAFIDKLADFYSEKG